MFTQGQFISLIGSYDGAVADLISKMHIVEVIRQKYNIGDEVYNELRKAVK